MKFTGLRGVDGVLGGDLVDVRTPFAMRDKVFHFVAGAFLFLLASRWTGLSPAACLGLVLAAALLNELVEDVRYQKFGWTRTLSDEADVADVAVTVVGGVIAWLVL